MSDFTVLRSLDGYCLVLDKKRIAGSKPDYRGENVLVDWTTEVVYGPVDDLAAENEKLVMRLNAEHIVRQNMERENAKLRDQKADAYNDMVIARLDADELQAENAKLRELVRDMVAEMRGLGVDFKRVGWCDYADRMRELGVDA